MEWARQKSRSLLPLDSLSCGVIRLRGPWAVVYEPEAKLKKELVEAGGDQGTLAAFTSLPEAL